MIRPAILEVAQCPDCGGRLEAAAEGARCRACARVFDGSAGYLDLHPLADFAQRTKYLDESLHADARHEKIAPPLLGSKIRNDMLRRFLAPRPGDRVLDLGCGSGRTLVWNADTGAEAIGIDISPFFAPEAVARGNVLLGDLRRLPLRDAAFTKAWTLDVLEHLSRDGLVDVLREANRVLAPGGALFVYTHVRRNGWIAGGVRAVNRLAARLERMGLLDLRQERLRKSDHLNPIADHDDLARLVEASGFRIARVTYYTPILGAFVENVLARMAERLLARRAARRAAGSDAADPATAVRATRAAAQRRVGRRGPTYRALLGVSTLMMLDILLFGRIRSGPFFALLVKRKDP
jgi:SAM-dependent methyltransferase